MEESKNPVIQEMLGDLCTGCERSDLCPLIHQWLEFPLCLRLIDFLNSWSHTWLTCYDVAEWIGGGKDQTRAALVCLMGQGIVAQQEVPQAGMTFYRLTEQEPQTKIITRFRDWYRRWQVQLQDAGEVLDLNWHDRRR